ncbi:MAG: hypothetical protein ACP5GA_07040 [Acidithiobacillus sp.]
MKWFWQKTAGPQEPPRGVVVEAGVPPQGRVDCLPLPEILFARHYHGYARLPEDPALMAFLLAWARSPDFLRDLPRQSARRFLASQPGASARTDEQSLTGFFKVLHSEITRRMYLDGARQREGVVGIRLRLRDPATASSAAQALVANDAHGLGPGIYPLNAVPENPEPGREHPFIIQIVSKKDLSQ